MGCKLWSLVIPTVASRGSRFALGWSSGKDLAVRTCHHVTLIAELPFELSDHLIVPSQSHLHLTTFSAPSSSPLVPIFLTFLIPTSLVSPGPPPLQPSSGSNSSSRPPSLLSERHLYTEGQIPLNLCLTNLCFLSPGECFCCVQTERAVFEVTCQQGLGGSCMVEMPHTSHRVLSHLRKRVLLKYQDTCQVCLLLSLMWFSGFLQNTKILS